MLNPKLFAFGFYSCNTDYSGIVGVHCVALVTIFCRFRYIYLCTLVMNKKPVNRTIKSLYLEHTDLQCSGTNQVTDVKLVERAIDAIRNSIVIGNSMYCLQIDRNLCLCERPRQQRKYIQTYLNCLDTSFYSSGNHKPMQCKCNESSTLWATGICRWIGCC